MKTGQVGGTRVLFSVLQGKPTTMVYRPLGPGNARYVFESPVRKSIFAHVAEVPGSGFTVQPGTGSYTLAASIPWSALAVQPRTGATLRGDLGLLFGDDTGANTAQRVHWVDRETNVVNDIPTEAEFFPERWGHLDLAPCRRQVGWVADPTRVRWIFDPTVSNPTVTAVKPPVAPPDFGWQTVYEQNFDDLPVGLKTTAGPLANGHCRTTPPMAERGRGTASVCRTDACRHSLRRVAADLRMPAGSLA